MESNKRKRSQPKDTPAVRKRRLQERLQEISAKSEQELAALMQSIEKLKESFRQSDKPPTGNKASGSNAQKRTRSDAN